MAFINVAEWSPDNVSDWLKGLDDSILPYVNFFLNNNINGCRLLLLSSHDLENLNVTRIGHQELILEGVDLLKHLHYNFGSETLQSLALRLGCKARSLFNQLKHDEAATAVVNGAANSGPGSLPAGNNKLNQDRVSTATLSGVSEILVSVKSFLSWVDRYPFDGQVQYTPIRKTVLKHSIELASTAQRDQFVEKPNQVIKNSCMNLAELCDRVVQGLNDSLAIQAASLEIVTVKKKPEEELGLHIYSSYSGIHIVGGIKFQSPSHRCGRVEDGDEIVQINYQTVVGWQLKKLVNTMKEYPMEILLTMKKRPRHSNIQGQVIVLKPYKIPSSRKSRVPGNRQRNAATTTTATGDSDDDAFHSEKNSKHTQMKGPLHQFVPTRKPKLQVRRRATISGASPTTVFPPVRIEDLVPKCSKSKKESVGRSVSHDQPKNLKLTQCLSEVPSLQKPNPVPTQSLDKSSSMSQVPYAKVQPLSVVDRNCCFENNHLQTIPKQIIASYTQRPVMRDIYGKVESLEENCVERNKPQPRPGQAIGVVTPSHYFEAKPLVHSPVPKKMPQSSGNHLVSSMENAMRPPPIKDRDDVPPPIPLRTGIVAKKQKASRRVSCKDLGEGDCCGWLYQRKEYQGFLIPSSRWSKRWVVLKSNHLYCYRHVEEAKADCLITLPGFIVSPAPECKSKKYAFKVYNSTTAFHFASDSQSDMNKWMNKLGLSAISFMSSSQKAGEDTFFSETDESEIESPSAPRNRRVQVSHSKNPYRDVSPGSTTSSSSSDFRQNMGLLKRSSTSSSSTSLSSAHRGNFVSSDSGSRDMKSPNTRVQLQPNISYYRSASSLDSAAVIAAKARLQRNENNNYNYARLAFPPPSPARSKKVFTSPKIAPRTPKLTVPRNWGTLQPPTAAHPSPEPPRYPLSMTQSWSNFPNDSLSLTRASVEVNPVPIRREPPKPLPRASKLKQDQIQTQPTFPQGSPAPAPVEVRAQGSEDTLSRSEEKVPLSVRVDAEEERLSNTGREFAVNAALVNPIYERVIRQALENERSKLQSAMSPEGKSEACFATSESGYLSMLDREYNRLFGKRTPQTSPESQSQDASSTLRTATSGQIPNLYPMKPRNVRSESGGHSSGEAAPCPQRSVSSSKLNRSHSPISDNSLSSSSGISSYYYSAYLDVPPEKMQQLMSTSIPSIHSAPELGFSGQVPLSPRAVDSDGAHKTSGPPPPPPTGNKPVKSSSFRLFSSPKLLKKLSTPKYQKERHLEKRDTKVGEETKTSKFFLNSPKLTRAIFGYKKEAEPKRTATSVNANEQGSGSGGRRNLNRSSSETSVSSGSALVSAREAKPKPSLDSPSLTPIPMPGEALTDSSDLPLTPETPRKPTMGVAMSIRKRRASNVSSDRGAIDSALQQHSSRSSPFNSSASPSCETSDMEDEWAHIVRTIEQVGLTIEGQMKGEGRENLRRTMSKPLDDEEMCHLVLSLRSLQRTLKQDKQTEINAIDELLKEPITLDKLQKWLQKYPHLLP